MHETSSTLANGLTSPDPFVFARNLIKSRKICKSYGVPLVYATDINDYPVYTSCPVGKDTAIFTPEGRISNCYLPPDRWGKVGINLSFGQVVRGTEISIDNQKLQEIRNLILDKSRCYKCFCRYSCAGGCHVCNTYPGSEIRYNAFCAQTRIISLCSLLTDLGIDNEVDELLDNLITMKSIAYRLSDTLIDFK